MWLQAKQHDSVNAVSRNAHRYLCASSRVHASPYKSTAPDDVTLGEAITIIPSRPNLHLSLLIRRAVRNHGSWNRWRCVDTAVVVYETRCLEAREFTKLLDFLENMLVRCFQTASVVVVHYRLPFIRTRQTNRISMPVPCFWNLDLITAICRNSHFSLANKRLHCALLFCEHSLTNHEKNRLKTWLLSATFAIITFNTVFLKEGGN
jgi:hypothetical protein